MPGLLYPAYQKFYSALSNLERFDKESNFFDNISAIDSFFTEYRNITFVMQASLKHTAYYELYEKNRDKFLTDHWFVEKRNETIKQTPFQLIKELSINIYFPYQGFSILHKKYSVENDALLETIFDEVKELFSAVSKDEIFFSTEYYFHEANSDIDLFDKLLSGIGSMQRFMEAMDNDINEECALCEELKERIKQIKIMVSPKDFLLIDDYIYYPKKSIFERGSRISLSMDLKGKKTMNRVPISFLSSSKYLNYDGTAFGSFTIMHAILRINDPKADIMPAILIVYDDGTFDMDVFHADIKTTLYRKMNEAAKLIETQNITEVYFMALFSVLPIERHTPMTSKERLEIAKSDILVCASIDNELNEKEYVFDGKQMADPQYIAYIMGSGYSNSLKASRNNLFPIWRAFKEKQKKQ